MPDLEEQIQKLIKDVKEASALIDTMIEFQNSVLKVMDTLVKNNNQLMQDNTELRQEIQELRKEFINKLED